MFAGFEIAVAEFVLGLRFYVIVFWWICLADCGFGLCDVNACFVGLAVFVCV